MATPNDLYAMTPERVTHEVGHLAGCYYNHVPEVDGGHVDYVQGLLRDATSDLVEIRFLKDWSFDGRRVWQLATVWFDGGPVMVIQNAGREGDDHYERFITDAQRFKAMCSHIRTILKFPVPELDKDVVKADQDIPGLTDFYGNELGGYFERY